MGLLKIIKAVMGLNGTGSSAHSGASDSTPQDVDVSVEHEPESEPATQSESAVKGTNVDSGDGATTTGTDSAPEPDVETPTADTAEPEVESETDPAADAETDGAVESGTEPDTTADEAADSEPAVEGADEAVDTISGIGPAYADRLNEVGIETVGDLASADAADVAADTDLSEKRVQGWIDNARGDD